MDVTLEKKGPCEALVRFTVPADEFAAEVRRGLAEAARHVRMKGFRPGKIPPHVMERSHGATVRDETKQRFLQKAYQRAIEENELQPAAHPRIAPEALELAEGGDFSHTFEVLLRPAFELAGYTGLAARVEPLDVADEEVEQAIENICKQRAVPEAVGEDGLPEDGMALCKVTLLHGDDPAEEVLSREGMRLSPSAPLPGTDPDAFRDAVTGKRDGDVVELPFTFPEEFEREELRGAPGTCRIELIQAFRIVPATEEELFEPFGVEDGAGLRAEIATRIRRAKEEEQHARIESELLEEVVAMHPMDLPEALVREQAEGRLATMREELERQGLATEELERELDERRDAVLEAATRSMRALFLIEAIADKEKLAVQEEDLVAELHAIAQRNDAPFDEVRNYYRDQNLFNQLAMELLERKVRSFLRESAAIEQGD